MNFEDARNKIYPWIKKTFPGDGDGGGGLSVDLLMLPWLADLAVFFAWDAGERFELLQRGHIPEELSLDELRKLAVQNLISDVNFRLLPTNFGGHMLVAGGDHEAAALCVDELWEFCAAEIGDNLIVTVPSKDVVLMVGESKTEELERMKLMAAEIMESSSNRALSSGLFFYDAKEKQFGLFSAKPN